MDTLRGAVENEMAADKAYCGAAQTKGTTPAGIHKQLWHRKRQLEAQLAEVDEALKTLNEDQTIQRLLRLMEVANR